MKITEWRQGWHKFVPFGESEVWNFSEGFSLNFTCITATVLFLHLKKNWSTVNLKYYWYISFSSAT